MKFLLSVIFSMFLVSVFAERIHAENTEPASGPEAAGTVAEGDTSEASGDGEETGAPATIWDEPLDGSSVESFQAGLDRVEQEVSEAEYRELMSGLGFLLFYDIGAKRDRATLYSRLDGKSPREIMERVQNHRSGKR